jgi:hypothetical protein
MTAKFDKFEEALRTLCREHGVMLASSGYEHLQVFDLRDGEDPLYGGIEDETKPADSQ